MSAVSASAPEFVLTATVPPHRQLLAEVSTWVAADDGAAGELVEAKLVDRETTALLRLAFTSDSGESALRKAFAPTAKEFGMSWRLRLRGEQKLLLAVSKPSYAVTELLSLWQEHSLDGAVAAVVSNHLAVRPIVNAFRIPFHHLPVGEGVEARADAEHRLLRLAKRLEVTTIVLARWMLVLSDQCVQAMAADGIDGLNLHHGDPSAFPGPDPYGQALARGVKRIGACAHYITPLAAGDSIPGLDQGRIIAQESWPIPAGATKRDLVRIGRRGAATLADAVVAHLQDRILPAGAGTEIL